MANKLKRNKEGIKINSKLLDSVREYCDNRGIKYSWYIHKAVEEKLERDTTKNH